MKEGEQYYDAANRRTLTILADNKCQVKDSSGEVKEYEGGTIMLGGQWEKIEESPLDRMIDRLR